jgi:hypothetical protein
MEWLLAACTGSVGSTHQQDPGAGMFAPQVCDLRVVVLIANRKTILVGTNRLEVLFS